MTENEQPTQEPQSTAEDWADAADLAQAGAVDYGAGTVMYKKSERGRVAYCASP